MSLYKNTIKAACKCDDKVAERIEEIMRFDHGVLDMFTTAKLNKLSRGYLKFANATKDMTFMDAVRWSLENE